MLTIFRGDDLAFAEYDRKVCVRFNTCQDLTGWAAKFCLYDNVKQTADISSRLWTFGYTAEETQVFPLGKTFGRLVVLDQSGQIRQMAKVEVEVVNQKLEPCIAGFIAISVDNVIADYNNMGNKPVLNGKTIEGIHDSAYYGLADAESVAQFQGLSDTVQAMSATVADQGAAIANNFVQLNVLKERVDNIDPTDYSAQINALSQRITAEESTRASADSNLMNSIVNEQNARAEDIENAKTEMQDNIHTAVSAIADGVTPISKLLFAAEGDTENYYRIQVVMRDDGDGNLQPALALDAVPVQDSESEEESSI